MVGSCTRKVACAGGMCTRIAGQTGSLQAVREGKGEERRGGPSTTSMRVFRSSKVVFHCLARMSFPKWYRESAGCVSFRRNYAELSRGVTFRRVRNK